MKKVFLVFMSLMLIMCLAGCGEKKDFRSIEEEINYIFNMDTSDEKMIKIMNIEKEIRKLSNEEKDDIRNMEVFYNETKITALELKENVCWNEFLNMDVDYLMLNDLVNIEDITKMRFIKGFSSIDFYIEKKEIIYNIINIIDVPYIDRISLSNNDVEIHDILISDSTEVYYYFLEITDNFYMNFFVYSNGYVSVSINNNNISNGYISIVRVNFNELKNICKYENLLEE